MKKKNPASKKRVSGKGYQIRMGHSKDYLKLIWTAQTLYDAKFIAKTYAKNHPTQIVAVNRED